MLYPIEITANIDGAVSDTLYRVASGTGGGGFELQHRAVAEPGEGHRLR